VSNYEKLEVWSIAHRLTVKIYKLTENFPAKEQFGLVSQMRRAAASIPMNIAEGSGRLHRNEFVQFINVARGSATELEYQLLLSLELGFLDKASYNELKHDCIQILKMLNGLLKTLVNQKYESSTEKNREPRTANRELKTVLRRR